MIELRSAAEKSTAVMEFLQVFGSFFDYLCYALPCTAAEPLHQHWLLPQITFSCHHFISLLGLFSGFHHYTVQ